MAFPWMAIAGNPMAQQGANLLGQLGGMMLQNHYNKQAARWERDTNRENADIAFGREMELLKFQLDYNTPYNQIARFKEAGLNPNLIYGQGSPGNMQNAPSPPVAAPARRQAPAVPDMNFFTQAMQLKLMEAQADLLVQKKDESGVRQDLMRVQTQVAGANPYLRPGYLDSVVSQMVNAAALKEQQTKFMLQPAQGTLNGMPVDMAYTKGWLMMERDLQMLGKRLDVAGADLKIKAEIFQSKEFQNLLLKIQSEWMQNADITPQHIYQGVMMLLQSLMR